MIASIGELLVEFICDAKDLHHLTPTTYRGPYPSGAPGIFIDQAARIAGRAMFAGAVGDDAFGRVILDRLQANGVSDALIKVIPDLPTGTAHVAYNSDGSREFVFNISGSAAAHLPDAATVMLRAGVTCLHISGSTLGDPRMRATALALCETLHAAGVKISIDPNIRPELQRDSGYLQAVRAIMAMATYVLPSDADAAVLWPGQDLKVWVQNLTDALAVVLKRGENGCIGIRPETIVLPAHPVTVIDPTGAGDCFCGTFVALMEMGHDFHFALSHANAAGALAVSKLGPMEGNSNLLTIKAFLAGAA
jgi:sugar/nucleoside kinase (ribokinase family)